MASKHSRLQTSREAAARCRFCGASGVTLVETLIAATILVVGLLTIAQLLCVSIRGHQLGRNSEDGSRLAVAKIEQLEKLDFGIDPAVQVTPGGMASLDSNQAPYFDNPITGFTRRWSVASGPTIRTRAVTVRITPNTNDRRIAKSVEITTVIRSW